MPKLIDTNVMLAASAIYSNLSYLVRLASPTELHHRETVYRALTTFEESGDSLVLDVEGLIQEEYARNMPFNEEMHSQEYGMMLLQNLHQTSRVNYVTIELDEIEGCAKLDPCLYNIVSDRADRKWIASAISHRVLYDNVTPPIVYAAESDWYIIESNLCERGFTFERLLPDEWYETRRRT